MSLAAVYEGLIKDALTELRKAVPDTGFFHKCGTYQAKACVACSDGGPLWVLEPLVGGARVEVLFLVGSNFDRMTAYFEDSPKPGPPLLASGW